MLQLSRKVLVIALVAAVFAALLLTGAWAGIFYLAPCALIVLAISLYGYVGEQKILSAASTRGRVRGPSKTASTQRTTLRSLARGGQLIAESLAVRPPPLAQLT